MFPHRRKLYNSSAPSPLCVKMMMNRGKCPPVPSNTALNRWYAFHFPNDRNFHYTHWNARCHTIEPLWVHASVLEFIESFKGSMRGMILVSGIRETLSAGRRWTARKEREYQELRAFIEDLVIRNARHDQDLSVLFF